MNYKKIVICTDFSENSEKAFEKALEIAKSNQASLDVLYVREPIVNPLRTAGGGGLSPEAIEATLKEIESAVIKKYDSRIDPAIDHTIKVREGHPSTEIVEYLKRVGADLAVTGASGISGLGRVLLGSVSGRVARKSPCDVLIVKPEKTES